MQFVPAPYYIAIRIEKSKQKEKKEKQGSLYIMTDSKNEARNTQCGEIVGLGSRIPDLFPQAKIGTTLLLHWMVESLQKDNKFFEDETYNYYLATASEHNGKANESYGIWDGENIIPNPSYIFLQRKEDSRELKQSDSGLFLFDNWTETRTDKEQQMAKINAEIQSLTKTKMDERLKQGIKDKESQLAKISQDINSKRIEFYKVAAINPDFNDEVELSFGHKIEIGDRVGMLNQACHTTIHFNGIEYIVALAKHFWCTETWCKESVKNMAAIDMAAV